MLILTRNIDEKIVIGAHAEIQITVIDVNNKQVRLGIEAPKDIRVDRLEIFNKRQNPPPMEN